MDRKSMLASFRGKGPQPKLGSIRDRAQATRDAIKEFNRETRTPKPTKPLTRKQLKKLPSYHKGDDTSRGA